MNNIIRIPLKPDLRPLSSDILSFTQIACIEINLHDLIDDYRAIIEIIDKNRKNLYFGDLIHLCDWLYDWYKKNDHYILSNRILDSFQYALSVANSKRENNR